MVEIVLKHLNFQTSDGKRHSIMVFELVVTISANHAYSLMELVKYFRAMIEQGHIPEEPGRSDGLTIGYCDELLEGLMNG